MGEAMQENLWSSAPEGVLNETAGETDAPAEMPEMAATRPRRATRAEGDAWLRLAFVGLPSGRCRKALAQWQDPATLLEAARRGSEAALLTTPGLTPTIIERLRVAATYDMSKVLRAMETHGIRLLLETDEEFPVALQKIEDAPLYLFVRGTPQACDAAAVAMVGTRRATEYGRGVAHKFAADLAQRGITVVSGLARGIDAAAHRGALEAGGRTFAVCGCGLDIVYPSEHKQLMADIEQHGAVFSEFIPTTQPQPWHFPARNRIISGLSAGVIVVEADVNSGALLTATDAGEQGREVFAVPGNIYKPQSHGTHRLIREGATLVESVADVIETLNRQAVPFFTRETEDETPGASQQPSSPAAVRGDLTVIENRVYLALDFEPRHIDDVATLAAIGAAEVNATLLMLELKGVARRLAGSMFIRAT